MIVTLDLGSLYAGEALQVQLRGPEGAAVGPPILSGFVDLGEGFYSWAGEVPTGFEGVLEFALLGGSPIMGLAAIEVPGGGSLGGDEFVYTLTTPELVPIPDAAVRITATAEGEGPVWAGTTDALGVARDTWGNLPRLTPGTYYLWRSKAGYSFDNPDPELIP